MANTDPITTDSLDVNLKGLLDNFIWGVTSGVRCVLEPDKMSPGDALEKAGTKLTFFGHARNTGVIIGAYLAKVIDAARMEKVVDTGWVGWPEPLDVSTWLYEARHKVEKEEAEKEAEEVARERAEEDKKCFLLCWGMPDGSVATSMHSALDLLKATFTDRLFLLKELDEIKDFLECATPGMCRSCRYRSGREVLLVRTDE